MTTVEQGFQKYLKRVFSDKVATLSQVQYREVKRAYFGGYGQSLLTNRDEIALVDNEKEAIAALDSLLNETQVFWEKESYEFSLDK